MKSSPPITSPYAPDLEQVRAWLQKMIAAFKFVELVAVIVSFVERMVVVNAELTKQLTVRERQVLKHLAAGKTNQEIADFLGLSLKTVEAYRTRLSAKTGLKRKADLVRFAFAAGLWECTPEDYLTTHMQVAQAGSST